MADNFFWYDVMTTDVDSAGKFYAEVVGWQTMASGDPNYTLFAVDGPSGLQGVAGLMPIPEDAKGMPPCWLGYIHVTDVEDTIARLTAADGKLHKGPVEIPGVIRFAVVADPQGAGFLIATPLLTEAPKPLPFGTPGTMGWRELYAVEWESAFAFYESLFGWTKDTAHDMGPMGTYQLFAVDSVQTGGIMTKPAAIPVPYWGYYINVDSVEAAIARLTRCGGMVVHGPMEVPGGQWVVQAKDPQGAFFALVSDTK